MADSAASIDRKHIKEQFDRYAGGYDLTDVKIRLKWEHTYYVAENSERIACSLSLTNADADLAWLLGMFHDIGRFEQIRRYHTFQDKVSVDHAQLSADLLFKDDLAETFLPDGGGEHRSLMDIAIRCHNRYRLPEGLSDREKMFAHILRDADKIDILRVNCQTPRTEIYDLPEEEFLYSAMTDEVYEAVVNGREVDRRYSKSGIDFIMGHVAFVFGLVYPESIKIMAEQGYLAKLLAFESQNPETQIRMERIRQRVEDFIDNKR